MAENKPPGLRDKLAEIVETVRGPGGKLWDALSSPALGEAFQHGSSELMSAAYTGNAFVQYGYGAESMQPDQQAGTDMTAADTGKPATEAGQARGVSQDAKQSLYGPEQEHDQGLER